jgi:hypothetical protein
VSARDPWKVHHRSAILRAVVKRGVRGASLLDVLVAIGMLALLVWLLRYDWARVAPPPSRVSQPAR